MTQDDCSNTQTGSALIATMQNIVTALNGFTKSFSASVAKPQLTGSFTLAAASTLAVNQPGLASSGSAVTMTPTNVSAANLMHGTKSLYVSVKTPGVGFTVATADGTNAVGTETFDYAILNPQ